MQIENNICNDSVWKWPTKMWQYIHMYKNVTEKFTNRGILCLSQASLHTYTDKLKWKKTFWKINTKTTIMYLKDNVQSTEKMLEEEDQFL